MPGPPLPRGARRAGRLHGLVPAKISLQRTVQLVVAWVGLGLLACGLGRLLTDVASSVDLSAVDVLRAPPAGSLTTTMRAITWLGSPVWLEVVCALAVLALTALRRWRDLRFLLLVSPGTVALVQLVKAIVARPRPPGPHLTPVTGFSWPSGHASSSAALYGALLYIVLGDRPPSWLTRTGWTVLAIGLISIGVSRVVLGVHYPSDVLGAWLIVAVWCAVVRRVIPRGE